MIYSTKSKRYRAYLAPPRSPAPKIYDAVQEPACPVCLEAWMPWARVKCDCCDTVPNFKCARCDMIVCYKCMEGCLAKCCDHPACGVLCIQCPLCREKHSFSGSTFDKSNRNGWIDGFYRRQQSLP